MHSGAFIVIEGPDGVGKTTVAKALTEELNRQHPLAAIYAREPGSTVFAEKVRKAFLRRDEEDAPIHRMTEVLALMSCKNQMIEEVVRPALTSGQHVVCDRYNRTLLAYQGGIRGVPYDKIIRLLAMTELLIMPHLEIFLNAPPAIRRQRRTSDINAMDEAAFENAQKLDEGFIRSGELLTAVRTVTIDTAEMIQDEVIGAVIKEADKYLKFHHITGLTMCPALNYTEWSNMQEDRHTALQVDQ